MASASLILAATLLLGPPVQRPVVTPTQPQPGEAAIAPAHVDTQAATDAAAEPVGDPAADPAANPVTDPAEQPVEAPVEQPVEEPGPSELPSWQADPVLPPTGDPRDVGIVDEWGMPVAPPIDRGPAKGGGFYAGAGALFGVMITRQWVTALLCEDIHCGFRGNADRVLGLGVMGFAAGGGWFDGRRAAWKSHSTGEPPKPTKGRRAAGWTLFALGIGGLITDTVLGNLCYEQAVGPYTKLNGFSYTCSPIASVVVIDFSTLIGAVGMGLGMSAEGQLRHVKKYNLSVSPWGGHGQVGLSLGGRF